MLTGISTLVDLDIPLPQLLEYIAAAGFDCVSLSHNVGHGGYHTQRGRAALRHMLTEFGLRLNYIHPPIQPYYDLTSLDEQVRRLSLDVLKLAVEACVELSGRAVTVHACNEKHLPDYELEPRVAAGLRSLEELGPFCAQRNVQLCVENLPGYMDANTVTLELLRRCTLPDVYVTLDTNHAWIGSTDPLALVAELAPRVRATHVSDTMGGHDSHLLPGAGVVDLTAVSAALAAAGFGPRRGDVVDLECSVMMQRKRLEAGHPHPGDPGHGETVPAQAPSIHDYLMLAHAAAVRFGEMVEATP